MSRKAFQTAGSLLCLTSAKKGSGEGDGQDESGGSGGAGAGARRRFGRFRRAGRRDQPALCGAAQARLDPSYPGAPCRGRLAHGRRLHPRQAGQYRRLHRHLGPGRHRHDHRPLRRGGGFRCRSCASPARRRARSSTRRISRRSTSRAIAKPVAKWAVTVREPALVPMVFQQAFHVMRSGRPGPVLIDLPIDVQMAEIEFDDRHLRAAAGLQAGGNAQAGGARGRDAERFASGR